MSSCPPFIDTLPDPPDHVEVKIEGTGEDVDNLSPSTAQSEGKTTSSPTTFFSEFLSSWREAAQLSPDGLGVGCVVLAPKSRWFPHDKKPVSRSDASVSSTSLSPTSKATPTFAESAGSSHYRLAEITGVQSAAGTVTVSFLFSLPGVDDEDVSIFDVIPCPLSWLTESSASPFFCSSSLLPNQQTTRVVKKNVPYRTLLERVLGVLPHHGSVPEEDLFQLVYRSSSVCDTAARGGGVSHHPAILWLRYLCGDCGGNEMKEGTPSSRSEMDAKEEEGGSSRFPSSSVNHTPTTTWTFVHHSFFTVHKSYAEAFHTIHRRVEEWNSRTLNTDASSATPAAVVLCLFDAFHLVERFNIFMTLRGHVVRVYSNSDLAVIGVKRPRGHLSTNSDSEGNTLPVEVSPSPAVCSGVIPDVTSCPVGGKVWLCALREDLRSTRALLLLLESAPPIDYFISFEEENVNGPDTTAKLMNSQIQANLKDFLKQSWTATFQNFPSQNISNSSDSRRNGETPVVKLSGEIFKKHKVLVPASPEQLLLLATVFSSSQSSGEKQDVSIISPGLLECISLGNFTDAAAHNLFSSYSSVTAVIGEEEENQKRCLSSISQLHHHFFVDPSKFGESFPVFAVVLSIVQDTYATFLDQTSSIRSTNSFPRIAIILPGTSVGDHSGTSQFIHNIKVYFSPWAVYHLTSLNGEQRTHDIASWYMRGGLLILFCDDTEVQISSLHMDADVVLGCGKRAATWVAASVGEEQALSDAFSPRYVAVISELEVVPQCESQLWTPYRSPSVPCNVTTPYDIEKEALWNRLVNFFQISEEKKSLPKALQQAMALGLFLQRDKGQHKHLFHMCKSIALSCATTIPFTLGQINLTNS